VGNPAEKAADLAQGIGVGLAGIRLRWMEIKVSEE
jgi:hypothetical protein